jgi:hypothetical protein
MFRRSWVEIELQYFHAAGMRVLIQQRAFYHFENGSGLQTIGLIVNDLRLFMFLRICRNSQCST